MTKTQRAQFNRMRSALVRIAEAYQSPDKLRRHAERQYGVSANEALEMAYENIQAEARRAVKGTRFIAEPNGEETPNATR
ncbi:MAG: hypothetical protein Q8K55_11385 [Gemmatimonadaceae bacterium]|nr:hypothetical protein [Gemmatimonadaceae bacterium]